MKEHEQIMQFLLEQWERYGSGQEFREFLLREIRRFIKDAREYDVIVSLLPESLCVNLRERIA
ncbi:MAG: hypothetical protein N0A16_09700 [Blastocatellia bacterium]|nr:hypothetical protein [Blastocatellia bacterium]MCS7157988.1 hypothetical protein [Blastocatellia bacterium]MCX7752495.1 hypothetical protein [Blastocatellia bacterium]MDW8167390.1 hypothetical protein [Acidobacteriota bacterium]MDW8257432.1 hypothetical protein [Acidobacteriota bacterium]